MIESPTQAAPRKLARDLRSIERPSHAAERRLRLRRAIVVGTRALCVALVVAAIVIALRKTGHTDELRARVALIVAGFAVLVASAIAYARRLPERAGAVALDRFHALSDRLSSALSFAAVSDAERTPFMDAAIDDALAITANVKPSKAVPLKAPPELPLALGLALAVAAMSLFEVRHHELVPRAKTIDAVEVTPDDLDAMREFLKEIEQKNGSEEAKAATQEFNQLIEDLAAKRLDRTEAFRKMQALEDKLLEGREADAKALEDALQKMGEEMKLAELTKPAGDALDNKNLAQAQKALTDLAKRLRDGSIDKTQLEKMREALKKASENQANAQKAIAERREELQKQLLQQHQKSPDGGLDEQEKSLLQKRERELEKLDREQQQQDAVGRQLDRLDRELSQAAEDLMKDLGISADDLDKSAEDINRMAREQMTQEEKEELRQELQELREMLRQQGQGGQQQMARLRKFQQHARGRGKQSAGGQSQQPGQESQNDPSQGGEQEQGDGQDGQNGQQGQGQNGQGQNGRGQGQGQGERWILGPNGEKLLLISRGQGQSGQGQGQGQNGGDGNGPPNPTGYGTGHDTHVQGAGTNPKVGTQDTQVAGQDTGQGSSRSEVIQGAAERGFASRGYQKVYREYHTVAEEALNKDDIPGGYRFYVRRYFQLIRPREEQR